MKRTYEEFRPRFTADGKLKFATPGGEGTMPGIEGDSGLTSPLAPNAKCGCGCDAMIETVRVSRDGVAWIEKRILRCLGYGKERGKLAADRAASARKMGWAYDYKKPCPPKTL